ncbi:kunitz-type serine protease inhibitor DrTI-like [Silene latifolia]|uniref:kunitz-type serine protease inhibitor DrTI-like n=1 Tax=Silene latifolia TaxID=37657 RepID=UPI003D77F3EF
MSPIFLLLSLLLFTPTTTTADIVLDYEGNPVMGGSFYYGISLGINLEGAYISGGTTMFNNGTVSCPSFIVAQSNISNRDLGIPIKFTPQISTEKNNIYTYSDLSIAFRFLRPEPLCRRRYTTVWAESANKLVLNGEKGSNRSWFKLEKVDYFADPVYKILYENKKVLYDQQPNGEILLSLEKGYPFLVFFRKIHEGSSSTTFADFLKMPRLPFAQGLFANK